MNRRRDIEGLRAVAVAAVLAFHAGVTRLSGGYVGVDVFFVISGFLITSLLIRERSASGRISFPTFYARRIRRLLPMSVLVAVLTAIASRAWLEPLRVSSVATDLKGVASFSVNFLFADRGADYLQSTLPPSPLQHYWSLAVEEQFYFVWPLLVFLVCVKARRVVTRVAVMSWVIFVASFVACMITMQTAQPWAFFSPHTRAFELAAGGIVATLPIARNTVLKNVEAALGWVGLAGIGACVVLFNESTTFPGPWALLPVIATMLVIRSAEHNAWGPHTILRFSPLQWLGSRSYSAYLWHWPILIIAPAMVGTDLNATQRAACIVMTLGLSELSYRYVENPIHRNQFVVGTRAGVLAVSLVLVVLGASLLTANNVPALATGVEATTPTLDLVTSTTNQGGSTVTGESTSTTVVSPTPTLAPLSGPIDAISQAVLNNVVPSNITPALSAAVLDESRIYKDGCHTSFSSTMQKDCVFGNKNGTIVVGLYGDSHAAEWFPTIEKVAIKRGWKLITYTKRGCPPAEIPTFSKVLGHNYKECEPWRKNVLKKMVSDKVQVVLVANFDRLLSATNKLPVWEKEWRAGLQGTIDTLKSRKIVPILVQDTPYPGQDIPTCLSANLSNVSQCSPVRSNAIRGEIHQVRKDLALANDVQLLETTDWFCTATVCPAVVGNLLVYRDDNHITAAYAKFLAPLLDAALNDYVSSVARGGLR